MNIGRKDLPEGLLNDIASPPFPTRQNYEWKRTEKKIGCNTIHHILLKIAGQDCFFDFLTNLLLLMRLK